MNLEDSPFARHLVLVICDKLFTSAEPSDELVVPIPSVLASCQPERKDFLRARYYLFLHSSRKNDSQLEQTISSLKSDTHGVLNPENGHLSEAKARLANSIIQIDSRLHKDSQSKLIKLAFLRLDEWIEHSALKSKTCRFQEVTRTVQILLSNFSLNKVNAQKYFFKGYMRVWLKTIVLQKFTDRPKIFVLCRYYALVKKLLEGIFVKQIQGFSESSITKLLVSLGKDFSRNFSQNLGEFFLSLDQFVSILLSSPLDQILHTIQSLKMEGSKAFLVDIFRALLDSPDEYIRSLSSRLLFEQFHQRSFFGNAMLKFSQLKSSKLPEISHSVSGDFHLRLVEIVFHLNLYQKNDLPNFFGTVLKNLGSLTLGTGQTSFIRLLLFHSQSDPDLVIIFLSSIIDFLKSMNDPHQNFDSQIHLLLDLLNQ